MKSTMLQMKVFLIIVCALFLMGSGVPSSEAALFDFDALPYPGWPPDVEVYMEGIYGSDMTVENAVTGDGIWEDSPLGDPGDYYIQSPINFGGEDWFSISFNEVKITEITFDWAVRINQFILEADGVVVFESDYSCGTQSGTETLIFGDPVTTLKIHDCGVGEVGIDNLCVTKVVPLPGTVWLFISGLCGLIAFRKKGC